MDKQTTARLAGQELRMAGDNLRSYVQYYAPLGNPRQELRRLREIEHATTEALACVRALLRDAQDREEQGE